MKTNYLLPFLTFLFYFQIYANHRPSDKSNSISHGLVINEKNLKNNTNLSEVSAIIETAGSPMFLEYDITLGTDNTDSLPLFSNVNMDINWSEGIAIQTITTVGKINHTYQLAATGTVQIVGSLQQFGQLNCPNANKVTKVLSFGGIDLTSLDAAFMNASTLIEVPINIPTTFISLQRMFFNTTLFNFDIGRWDVSHVTNMVGMFFNATSVNQDTSTWNLNNVTNMECMFNEASSFNQVISAWDVSNVTNMFVIFAGATSFNQNISRWNLSNFTNMRSMFFRASSFNQDISTSSIFTKQRVQFCYYSNHKSI